MKKSYFAIGLIAAFSFALAGCGGSQTEAEPAGTKSSKTEPAEQKTPLSQEEWVKLCGDDGLDPDSPRCTEDQADPGGDENVDDGDEMGIPEDEKHHIGDEFRVNTFDIDHTIYHWEVTVTGIETANVLKDAADNPDYDGGNAERIDAKPDEGNEFIHVTYQATNTSGAPSYLALDASVIVENGDLLAPLGDDGEDYTPNLTQQHDMPAGDNQNTDTTSKGDWVIEVPKGTKVSAILLEPTAIDSEDEYWVFAD